MVALVSYVALRKSQALLRATAPALAALGLLVAATGCAGDAGTGHVAIGGVGPSPSAGTGHDVPPDGEVVLVPLDGPAPAPSGTPPRTGTSTPSSRASQAPPSSQRAPTTPSGAGGGSTARTGTGTESGTGSSTGSGSDNGSGPGTPPGTGAGSGGPGGSGGSGGATTEPPTAARLTVSVPTRTADADRWCEKVTVTFTNTGGLSVTGGTVTFGTHIIGGLGIDWATVETAEPVPAPLAGGATRTASWDLCVDAWRVPLGMHIETRDVTLS